MNKEWKTNKTIVFISMFLASQLPQGILSSQAALPPLVVVPHPILIESWCKSSLGPSLSPNTYSIQFLFKIDGNPLGGPYTPIHIPYSMLIKSWYIYFFYMYIYIHIYIYIYIYIYLLLSYFDISMDIVNMLICWDCLRLGSSEKHCIATCTVSYMVAER